jgi:predicted MPP superfamily phosphohydrolase
VLSAKGNEPEDDRRGCVVTQGGRGDQLAASPQATRWDRWIARLERRLYRNGWAARLGCALGMPISPRVRRHAVELPDGPPADRPLRIAFASDFHAGPTTHPALLAAACAALHDARPDLLLLGGDFVGADAAAVDALTPLLGQVAAPLGRFAVLGNHDWWSSPGPIVNALTRAGVDVLINRNVRLAPPFDRVWICGLDDHSAGAPDAEAALHGAAGIRVVLMHSPSNLLDLGRRRFDLALCGHTHGGQMALPGGIPLVVAEGLLSRKYSRGRYDLDSGGVLIVSVGLGCTLLPFRTFAHPEIMVCDVIGSG